MEKKDKPRLAEILGVEVGEIFTAKTLFGVFKRCSIDKDGDFLNAGTNVLCYIINHPESIIRQPRLTPEEMAVIKGTKAKWVTKNKQDGQWAYLWRDGKPEWVEEKGRFFGTYFAKTVSDVFPSVNPGDCICVEEAIAK